VFSGGELAPCGLGGRGGAGARGRGGGLIDRTGGFSLNTR